uniref:Uncharacterized protein n=1 Tax=viral metagenome TaxID=1070528 RepID=A0A6H1ZE00_9ZZZZ
MSVNRTCSRGESCPLCAAIASQYQALSELVRKHHPVRWCSWCGDYRHHYYDDARRLQCKDCDSVVRRGGARSTSATAG